MNSAELNAANRPRFVSSAGLFTQHQRNLVLSLLLAVATAILYFPVNRALFLNLDGNQYVTDNIDIQDGLNWDTVKWAFTSYYSLNWHPLTWLSHALDVQLFGLNPARHHDVNLLLHVLNVLLLFWVLERATGYAGRSAVVAALFAVHPINVEAVAWITERKTLLSMLFFLLALGTYRWYSHRPGIARYALVALWFALGLMAKPQIITLPFVLLLWDYWPLRRLALRPSPFALRQNGSVDVPGEQREANNAERPSGEERTANSGWRWLVLEKLPLLVLCIPSSILTMQAQRAGGAMVSLVEYSLRVRLENALVAYVRYIGKAFWPSNLTPMYPHPGNSIRMWQAAAALLLLLAISGLVWEYRRRRYLLVGWLWFLGTMVPMIGIVQVGHQAMADRYAYVPFIGLYIMICWGVADLFATVPLGVAASGSATADRSLGRRRTLAAPYLAIATGLALVALSVVTHRQLGYWSDNLTLWSHVSQVLGTNSIAEERMGEELMDRRELEAAMRHFSRAVAIDPNDPLGNFALAVYKQKQRDLPDAIRRYKIVVSHAPNVEIKTRALTYMSYAYRDLGDSEQARESLQAAENLQH
jgi:protein O-mannosyl-transferase